MNKKTLWVLVSILAILFLVTLFFGLRESMDKDNLILLVDNQTEIITRYDEELVVIQERLQEANRTIDDKEVELGSMRLALEAKTRTAESLEDKLNSLEDKLNSVQGFYTPSFDELRSLVRKSGVSRMVFDLDTYNCVEFSNDLIAYLKDNKIYSCASIIDINDDLGHVFVAVMTTQGLWYVEPQTNQFFNEIFVSDNYCDVVDWNCDWEITKVSSCYGVQV